MLLIDTLLIKRIPYFIRNQSRNQENSTLFIMVKKNKYVILNQSLKQKNVLCPKYPIDLSISRLLINRDSFFYRAGSFDSISVLSKCSETPPS